MGHRISCLMTILLDGLCKQICCFSESSGSRLVREEDDQDGTDGEEERIKMHINTAADDRLRRRAEFDAAQVIGRYLSYVAIMVILSTV